jgi:hypothetical protein
VDGDESAELEARDDLARIQEETRNARDALYVQPGSTAVCPYCQRSIGLSREALLRWHGPRGNDCPGSGQRRPGDPRDVNTSGRPPSPACPDEPSVTGPQDAPLS